MNDEFPRVYPHGATGATGTSDDVDVDIDDDATSPAPAVAPKAAAINSLGNSPSGAPSSDAVDSQRKPRPRMTLRIPDDEVARPHSQPPPEARPSAPRPEISPSRIITINPPPQADAAAKAPIVVLPAPPPAPRMHDNALRPSTTAADGASRDVNGTASRAASRDAPNGQADERRVPRALESMSAFDSPDTALDVIPVRSSDIPPEPLQSSDALELDEAESAAVLSRHPAAAAGADATAKTEAASAPRAPSPTVPDLPASPDKVEARAPAYSADSEGVDIPVDEDDPPPSSDAEIAPEDLVSVESMPHAVDSDAVKRVSFTPAPPIGMQSTPNLGAYQTPPGGFPYAQPAPSPSPVGGATASLDDRFSPSSDPHLRAAPAAAPAVEVDRGDRPQLVLVPPPGSPLAPPPMNETSAAAAARKRARPWWEELFGDDFIRTMAKITDAQIYGECDFIEDSLGVARGAMVLDLGCGTGRHAIELTRRGYQVVGYDLSLPMLARAADEAQERDQKLNFLQGDMRDMTFEDTFDGIYSWNTSFGFFEEEKNAQVITRVHKALRMGGQFLLDVINRDFLIRQAPSLAWFEGDGCICMDEMQIDWITSRMRVKRTMMMDDGRSKEIEYSVRVYSLHELGKILHDHGFRVAEVSGRTATPGVFFGNESPRTLILAEKR